MSGGYKRLFSCPMRDFFPVQDMHELSLCNEGGGARECVRVCVEEDQRTSLQSGTVLGDGRVWNDNATLEMSERHVILYTSHRP